METLEQRVAEAVNKKLNDGTVERMVGKCIEDGIAEALKGLFSWNGAGKKLIEEKLDGIIVPAIERHDFNRYLTKLDSILTEIVNSTSLMDNKAILENFKGLMKEPGTKEVKLSEIFKQYCRHVAANVDTGGLEALCDDDGEPCYGHVAAAMEVVHEDKGWLKSNFDECTVKFTCEEDGGLNCQVKLYKEKGRGKWRFSGRDPIDINSLRGLGSFEVYLMALRRGVVDIIMDKASDYDDDIEPEEKPEWSLK